jgi:glycerate 2-kinase
VRVVLAPDKFKGSLTAREVADRVAAGILAAVPGTDVVRVPVADGGDGTVDAALAAGYDRVPVRVQGPTGEPVDTAFALRDGVAVVEMAGASGLALLTELAPLTASSYGTGEVVAAALDRGCHTLVLGIGGSASTDGGAGMLEALGARAVGASAPGGAALAEVTGLDLSGLHPALATTSVVVACDVDNPLLGPHGAAAVYGPQKGATPQDVVTLDAALARWADVVEGAVGGGFRDRPGAGAAGGVGFAALAVLGAQMRTGIELVLDLTGFADHLPGADLVVTGEGALDEQTLRGKAPAGVAAAARAAGVPVVAVAGVVALDRDTLAAAGIEAAYGLTDIEPDVQRCLADAGPLLEDLATRLAHDRLESSDDHGSAVRQR